MYIRIRACLCMCIENCKSYDVVKPLLVLRDRTFSEFQTAAWLNTLRGLDTVVLSLGSGLISQRHPR